MKNVIKKGFFLTAAIVFSTGVWLTLPPVAFANDLAAADDEGILTEIHNRCQDEWCEGAFGFYFHTFSCSFDSGKCLFGFEYTRWRDVEDSFEAECSISANSEDDLFADEETYRMSRYLYNQISACMDLNSSKAWDYYKEIFGS